MTADHRLRDIETTRRRRQMVGTGLYWGVSASEIINELPKLTEAERQAILDKLPELAQVDDDRWEQIINEPMPRPKLKAFIEQATAECDNR